jgi:hypothetical protein
MPDIAKRLADGILTREEDSKCLVCGIRICSAGPACPWDDCPYKAATFHRHEIELLINRALAIRDPLTMRSRRWVRWAKKIAASDDALYRFHEVAAAALQRFDQEEKNSG